MLFLNMSLMAFFSSKRFVTNFTRQLYHFVNYIYMLIEIVFSFWFENASEKIEKILITDLSRAPKTGNYRDKK